MQNLNEIKQKYAQSEDCDSIEELFGYLVFEKRGIHKAIDKIAKLYAEECVKASLEKAYSIASIKLDLFESSDYEVLNKSITNESNIILL